MLPQPSSTCQTAHPPTPPPTTTTTTHPTVAAAELEQRVARPHAGPLEGGPRCGGLSGHEADVHARKGSGGEQGQHAPIGRAVGSRQRRRQRWQQQARPPPAYRTRTRVACRGAGCGRPSDAARARGSEGTRSHWPAAAACSCREAYATAKRMQGNLRRVKPAWPGARFPVTFPALSKFPHLIKPRCCRRAKCYCWRRAPRSAWRRR